MTLKQVESRVENHRLPGSSPARPISTNQQPKGRVSDGGSATTGSWAAAEAQPGSRTAQPKRSRSTHTSVAHSRAARAQVARKAAALRSLAYVRTAPTQTTVSLESSPGIHTRTWRCTMVFLPPHPFTYFLGRTIMSTPQRRESRVPRLISCQPPQPDINERQRGAQRFSETREGTP